MLCQTVFVQDRSENANYTPKTVNQDASVVFFYCLCMSLLSYALCRPINHGPEHQKICYLCGHRHGHKVLGRRTVGLTITASM